MKHIFYVDRNMRDPYARRFADGLQSVDEVTRFELLSRPALDQCSVLGVK